MECDEDGGQFKAPFKKYRVILDKDGGAIHVQQQIITLPVRILVYVVEEQRLLVNLCDWCLLPELPLLTPAIMHPSFLSALFDRTQLN